MLKNTIIFITVLFLAYVNPTYAKTYIVCVGLRDYPGFANDLQVSDQDATYIAELYRRNGNAEVVCIKNRNATASNVIGTMRRMYAVAGPDDTVILFFSGHGERGVFRCYDRPIPYSTITECMKLGNSKKRFVIADACMSGSMRNNRRTQRLNDISVMFFLSSRNTEPSRELYGMRNSVFTNFLYYGLKGYADTNKDRMVTAKEFFTYVSNNVINITNRRQHPVMWGNFNDNMVIMRW